MSNTEQTTKAGKMFFHLIDGTDVFGDVETIQTERGIEILIKQPFIVHEQKLIPYMSNILGKSPGAICIHPMNVLWNVPLDEFKEIEEEYIKLTTGLVF